MARPAGKNRDGGTRPRPASTRPSAARAVERPPLELSTPVAVGVMLLATLVFFWQHITGGAFLWEDFREFTYPHAVYAARTFAAGLLPFWNPYSFNGMPFLADLQVGFFYPGNLLMYALSGGTLSDWLAQFFVVLHYPLAMFGAWKLTRWFGVGSWGALFAGIAYGLTGMLVVHMIHPNMVEHLAWFPLVVYLFGRGVRERSLLHALLAGLALGVSMLAGHPQSTLYVVLYLFAFAIYLLVTELRGEPAGAKRSLVVPIVAAAIPIAVAVGIFAIQLLPSQELAGLSERAEMSYEKSLEGALAPGQVITYVAPKYFGISSADPDATQENPYWYPPERNYYYWETAVYIGVVTLILAIVGLATGSLGRAGWFLAGMGFLGLLYAVGDSFFIHPLVGRLPLFDAFRIPTRMAIYLALGFAVLAGAGLERLIGAESERARRPLLFAAGGVGLVALMVAAGFFNSLFSPPEMVAATRSGTGIAPLLLALVTLGVGFAALKGSLAPTAAAAALTLLLFIDLALFGMGQNTAEESPQRFYEAADAQFANFRPNPPDSLFRVKMREGGFMLMPRNQGLFSGIMLYEGYNPLLLARRVPPAADLGTSFDLLSIRYDVAPDPATGQGALVRRETALPRAWLVHEAKVVDSAQAREAMKTISDVRRVALLEEDPGVALKGGGTGSARVVVWSPEEIVVEATTDAPAILMLSEIWYPNWKVTIDGKPARLLRADYSLRGVALPAGTHRVAMTYTSSVFTTGLWVTIATLIVAVAGIFLLVARRRSARSEAPGNAPDEAPEA